MFIFLLVFLTIDKKDNRILKSSIILAIIKRHSEWNTEIAIENQLILLNIPTSITDTSNFNLNNLKLLLKYGVGSYFDLLRSNGNFDDFSQQAIDNTKTKLNKVFLDIQSLQQFIQIPDLLSNLPIEIQDWLNENCNKSHNDIIQQSSDLFNDKNLLNLLQSIIQDWIKRLQRIINMTHDPINGTISDEIKFWESKENVLLSIKEQLESPKIILLSELMYSKRRTHTAVALLSNISLKDSLKIASQNNEFLKHLNVDDVVTSESLIQLQTSATSFFTNFKKIKLFKYPVERAIDIIKLITIDFENQLIDIISHNNLFLINSKEFDELSSQISTLLSDFDADLRLSINSLRELLRKQANIFIPIKNETPTYIKDVLTEIRNIRKLHTDMNESILLLMNNLEFNMNDQMDIYQQLYTEANNSFNVISSIQIKLLFSKKMDVISSQKIAYTQQISFIERKIASLIKTTMLNFNGDSDLLFKMFKQFDSILQKPQVRLNLQDFHNILLQATDVELENLEFQCKNQKQIIEVLACKRIPTFSSKLFWIKQVLNSVSKIFNHLELVLTKDWSNYPEGKRFSIKISTLISEIDIDVLFNNWLDSTSNRISGSFLNSLLFIEKPKNNKLEYSVNIDYDDLELNDEIKCLQILNFSIPGNIKSYSDKIYIVHRYASNMNESLKHFYSLFPSIERLGLLKILIIPTIKNVDSLIYLMKENTWSEVYKAEEMKQRSVSSNTSSILNNIDQLQEQISVIIEQVVILSGLKDQFDRSINSIRNCEYDDKIILKKLSEIQEILYKIFEMKLFDPKKFNDTLNKKIENILIEKCNNQLNAFYRMWSNNDLSFLHKGKEHQIIVQDLSISIDPPLTNWKECSIAKLNSIISVIRKLKKLTFVNYLESKDSFYYEFQNETFMPFYQDCLGIIFKSFIQAEDFYSRWTSLQFIWDIEILKLSEIKEENISLWLQLYDKLKTIRETFDTVDTYKTFGLIKIEYEQAQGRIYTQFSLFYRKLVESFGIMLQESNKNVYNDLSNLITNFEGLSFNLNNTQSIILTLSYIRRSEQYLLKTDDLMLQLKTGNSILTKYRYNFSDDWLHFTEIQDNVKVLESLILQNSKYLNDHIELITSAIKNEVRSLNKAIVIARGKWNNQKPNETTLIQSAVSLFQNFEHVFNDLNKTSERLNDACKVLNLPFNIDMKNDIDSLSHLRHIWSIVMKLHHSFDDVKNVEWNSVKLSNVRTLLDDSLLFSRSLPSDVRSYPALESILLNIKNVIQLIPFLLILQNGSLTKSHWNEIFEHIKLQKPPDVVLLGDILDLNLSKNEKYIKSIVSTAEAESLLDKSINEIESSWNEQKFEIYVLNSAITLFSGSDNLLNKIEDDLNTLGSISVSPYYAKFAHRVRVFEEKLNAVSEILTLFYHAQKQWVYLLGVFKEKDELGSLMSTELTRFENVSYDFKYLINSTLETSNVLSIIEIPNVLITIKRISESLLKIRKSLVSYLEKQREQFPRFYFINNDDLLEFIGNSTNKLVMAKHIKKIFPGISALKYEEEGMLITGIMSAENEEVPLIEPVSLIKKRGLVNWLQSLEDVIKITLASFLAKVRTLFNDFSFNLNDKETFLEIIQSYPSQILVLSLQIEWTKNIEKSILNSTYQEDLETLSNIFVFFTTVIKLNLPNLTRIKVENLLIEVIHKYDVLHQLQNNNVTSVDNIIWFSEQKFYFDSDTDLIGNVPITHGSYSTNYAYEYLGAVKKLAYTPLLTSTFALLAESLDQKLGGLLLGPAGTGKTETVKALGYSIGRVVFVFCCDESFDVEAVGRILLGISQVGAFGCFDEFNRLNENILSGISTQIEKMQIGLAKNCEINIAGKLLSINQDTGIFITNNPNYEGRSALPDNLKSKFLTYSLMVPDSEIITSVLLSTHGFVQATDLASKLAHFFSNMRLLCSEQKHYDFGLRNLKSVIVHSGKLNRKFNNNSFDNIEELDIIQKSCYDVVLPRLVSCDEEIFYNEIAKFDKPFSDLTKIDDFSSVLTSIAKTKGLTVSDDWLLKCIQIYEISQLNHGFMLVGDSCVGKSTCFDCSIEAISVVSKKSNECFFISPKVIDKTTMFGKLDYTTREWKDGILTSILRTINENLIRNEKKNIWIIFDGDIDPTWVENLNSVLDDTKLLTLPNGERISIPDNIRFVFEVNNLLHATPATISRCGIVLFNKPYFTITNLFKKLLTDFQQTRNENEADINKLLIDNNSSVKDLKDSMVNSLYDILDHTTLTLLWNNCLMYKAVLKNTEYKVIRNITKYIDEFFNILVKHISNNSYLSHGDFSEYFFNAIFLAVVWSFAGEFVQNDTIAFINKLLKIPKFQKIQDTATADTLLHMTVDPVDGKLKSLEGNIKQIDLQPHMILGSGVVIPTIDTVKYENVIHSILDQHEPLVLCGPPGSGKTMLLLATIRKTSNFELICMNFSRETTIISILKALEQSCQYKKSINGTTLCPKIPGKWMVLFCDELNLPKADKYGTQLVIEFLRQIIIQHGFWHPKKKSWVTLQNIQFVGACNPTSTSNRYPMSDRFLNFCTTIMIDYPSTYSLRTIYQIYSKALLRTIPDMIGFSDAIAYSMVEVYVNYKEKFSNINIAHYICSPRELTRWIKGLCVALKPLVSISLENLVRLWAHEGLRLFHDKLTRQDEKDWVCSMIFDIAKQNFPHIDLEKALKTPLLFSDWLNYEYQSVDENSLKSFVKERFNIFNQEESNADIILYDELLEHILRIDRVLKNDQGHLILVGPSGSGKTTLTKFVSWMNGIRVVQLNITKSFSLSDFEKILRNLLIRSAVQNEKICFIIDESTILEDSFLEKMNTLLANAEVPGLFDGDDYDALMDMCLKASQNQGLLLDSSDEIYNWFVKQISQNFHVVFTMSDPYSNNSKPFISSSALFNRCVVNWMGTWSDKSLFTVAKELTSSIPLDKSDYKIKKEGNDIGLRYVVIDILVLIHSSYNQLTSENSPLQFLNFIKSFTSIFIERENVIQNLNSHVNKGLDHLKEMFLKVKQLSSTLEKQETQLQIEEEKSREILDKMIMDQNESERKQDMSMKMQELFSDQEKAIMKRKKVVVEELNEVETLIAEAQQGVLNIKKQHLTELRSMHNPPETIKMILESICILLGYDVSSWRDVQHVIRKDDFIASIISFKGEEQITTELINYMEQTYLSKNNFNYESANRASKACGPLLMWVKAQLKFSSIVVKVKPLKKELQKLENELFDTKAKLIAINEMINDLKEEVEKYKVYYSENIRIKENIKIQMEDVKTKLDRSVKLLKSLKSERQRWEINIAEYDEQKNHLIGDTILLAAFTAYCGSGLPTVREELIIIWKGILAENGILFDSNIGLANMPGIFSADDLIQWQKLGLPNDDQFISNTAILTSTFTNCFPFVIDPSGQFIDFLPKLIAPKQLVISSFLDPEFNKKLENCIKFGGSILIQDGEYYDPIINRLISGDVSLVGAGRMIVKLGDKEIDMSPDFKLYILTKDSTIELSPFISSRMKILNYTFTKSTIINESLNITLNVRDSEIESKRLELVKRTIDCKSQLRFYEKDLLDILGSSKDNILDDNNLLTKLETIKKETEILEFQMNEITGMMNSYNDIRNKFEPLAHLYAQLIQVFHDLSSVNKIYKFSNDYIKTIFKNTLERTTNLPVDKVKFEFIKVVYKNVSTSLLQQDRLLFQKLITKLTKMEVTEDMSVEESILASLFIILRTNKGSDSTIIIEQLASNYENISIVKYALGGSYGSRVANRLINENKNSSVWLIIENIEISNEFLELITDVIEQLKSKRDNKEGTQFKLIMTTKIESNIPSLLIQLCKQIIIENEISLKKGVSQLMLNESSTLNINKLSNIIPKKLKKILFILVWYYSIIISRLRFACIGFSKRYEINQSDLKNAEKFIIKFIKSKKNLIINDNIFETIGFMIHNLIFGGKIDDSKDLEFITKLGNSLFNKNMFSESFNLLSFTTDAYNDIQLYAPKGSISIDYVNFIENLPDVEPMEWLELPSDTMVKKDKVRDVRNDEIINKILELVN